VVDAERRPIIKIVAKRLRQQKKSSMAANLYLDIGENIKALKCLITEGNIEKVISVTNMMRSTEGYNLAANFLQNCDWNIRTDLIKHIIAFYNKAKNFDSLANFFEACSMYEVDEFKNYEKALKALTEAEKYAEKTTDLSTRHSDIQKKIKTIEKYMETKASQANNPEDAMMAYRE
jgi:intraflagellar transport protein 140